MGDTIKARPIPGSNICRRLQIDGATVARIAFIDEFGQASVVISESGKPPVTARLTSQAWERLRQGSNLVGQEVLIAFDGHNPELPIIVDTVHSLRDEAPEVATTISTTEGPQELRVDGKCIVFAAENEIVLRCGKASITLTSAGKILLKGEYVLSHSKGSNKIKGGAISIN